MAIIRMQKDLLGLKYCRVVNKSIITIIILLNYRNWA